LRLERCQAIRGIIFGEFCRKQTRNIPPFAHDDGMDPMAMPAGHGLGHPAAFLYHRRTRVFVLQSNRLCATPGRIAAYVSNMSPGAFFHIAPIIHPDALEMVRGKQLRSVQVRFASIDNLEALERDNIAAARAAREAAEAYGADSIEITLRAGLDRASRLNGNANAGLLARLLRSDSVETLKVKAVADGRVEPIDLIDEKMQFSTTLDLPEADTDGNFRSRVAWIEQEFRARLPDLEAMYGNSDGHQD
jgi:hypothetical protein